MQLQPKAWHKLCSQLTYLMAAILLLNCHPSNAEVNSSIANNVPPIKIEVDLLPIEKLAGKHISQRPVLAMTQTDNYVVVSQNKQLNILDIRQLQQSNRNLTWSVGVTGATDFISLVAFSSVNASPLASDILLGATSAGDIYRAELKAKLGDTLNFIKVWPASTATEQSMPNANEINPVLNFFVSNYPLNNHTPFNNQAIYALGAFGSLLVSADQGLTWQESSDSIDNLDAAHWYTMADNKNIRLLAGEYGQINYQPIDQASDSQSSLSPQSSQSSQSLPSWINVPLDFETTIYQIVVLNSKTVFLLGLSGEIIELALSPDSGQPGRVKYVASQTLCESITPYTLISSEQLPLLKQGQYLLFGSSQSVVLVDFVKRTCSSHELTNANTVGVFQSADKLFVLGGQGASWLSTLPLVKSLQKDLHPW